MTENEEISANNGTEEQPSPPIGDAEAYSAAKKSKVKRGFKIAGFSVGSLAVTIILTVIIYLLYVILSYSRIDDNITLGIRSNRTQTLSASEQYSIVTYNVGFGAYGPNYTFFMDTGEMKNGKKTAGTRGTAISKADVKKNISGSANLIKTLDPDFAIIQEVDFDSTRSYKIDERNYFAGLDGYGSVFAQNYHSSYLFYPFTDPHGANNSGIMTLSKYKIEDSRRYAFPISDGLSKFTDLDRCFSVTHVPVGNKYLTIISLHMSAYDEGGKIRKKQAELLKNTLSAEYEKGNYVIAGGDFNQDLIGKDKNGLTRFPSEQKIPEWVASYEDNDIPSTFVKAWDQTAEVGSCRGADIKWERGKTYTCMIDGFLVSKNIEITEVKLIDNDFAFSDHNPVKMTFKLL